MSKKDYDRMISKFDDKTLLDELNQLNIQIDFVGSFTVRDIYLRMLLEEELFKRGLDKKEANLSLV